MCGALHKPRAAGACVQQTPPGLEVEDVAALADGRLGVHPPALADLLEDAARPHHRVLR